MDDIDIQKSLKIIEDDFYKSIILNPVENIPFKDDLKPSSSFLHGLYNSDKVRTDKEQINTKTQFAGRETIAKDIRIIYNEWAEALQASDVTLRTLSGLHSHIIFFMGMANIGDSILLLPEKAGGHMSTKAILERLGLNIIEMVIDYDNYCIDINQTINLYNKHNPKFVFVDRSEGLVYEDFQVLLNHTKNSISIFDASQYLTNIISKDFKNPFEMGFQYIVSTLHKNFPGPQRALIATKNIDSNWKKLLSNVSTYVSNMHVYGIYTAGLTLNKKEWILNYSKNMIQNTKILEHELQSLNINILQRPLSAVYTHHIWILCNTKEDAFKFFKELEKSKIYVNYRKLPYDLGYGLRLGLSALTRLSISEEALVSLANLINYIFDNGSDEYSLSKSLEISKTLDWSQ